MTRLILATLLVLATAVPAAAQSGSYLRDIQLAQDPTFLKRVERAIVQSAVFIRAEAPGTANHAARSAWAGAVLNNPAGYAVVMAPGFTTQSPVAGSASCTTTGGATTCTTPATDAQLQTISDSLWNDYSVP